MPSRSDLESLLIYDPSRARSTVNVWVSRPSSVEEESHGKLFLISAIDSASHANHEIIGIIQDELKTNFYKPNSAGLERQFEEALHQVNQRLHSLIADGVNDWIDRVHILAGAIRGSQLILAPVRSVHAFVLRESRLYDVLGLPDESPINPLRFFSQVFPGHIKPHDRLICCLPSLLDYFSLEKLRRTVLDHTPAEAARVLEQALVGVDPSMTFGALIFSFAPSPEVTPTSALRSTPIRVISPAPQQSMSELVNRERATENILAPSVWPVVKEIAISAIHNVQRIIRTKLFRLPPRRAINTTGLRSTPPSNNVTKSISVRTFFPKIVFGIKSGSAWILSLFRSSRVTPEATANYPVTKITPARRTWFDGLAQRWSRTTGRQRWIIGGIAVALILLITTIINTGGKPATTANNQTSTSSEVQQAIDNGQSALLYGGDSTAQEALAAAVSAYDRLPTKGKTAQAQKDQLGKQIEELRQRLSRRVTIASPAPWVKLTDTIPDFHPQQIYILTKYVVAYDPSKKIAATIDRTQGTVSSVPLNLDVGTPLTGAAITKTAVVFITDRRGLVELDTTNKSWKEFDVSFGTWRPAIQGLAAFQNRLYLLDRGENLIIRFTRGSNSYGAGQTWLKEEVDFSQTRGLAVDGSIFVLKSNGLVEEYFNGRKSNFALKTINPELNNATRILTNDVLKNIYLLEPSNKRLVVFDKKGQLVKQYDSEQWGGLIDAVSDEATQELFLLNGTDLFRTNIVSQ